LGTGSVTGPRDFTPGIVRHLRGAQPLVGCTAFGPFAEFSGLSQRCKTILAPDADSTERKKIVSNNSGLRKFLLNWFGPDQDAWQRFSVATDVIAFLRLDHLTTDQNGVSQGALK
jgi:hypothetical protein